VNNDDFVTGEGENSQDDVENDSEPDHAAEKESINSLLEADLGFSENVPKRTKPISVAATRGNERVFKSST